MYYDNENGDGDEEREDNSEEQLIEGLGIGSSEDQSQGPVEGSHHSDRLKQTLLTNKCMIVVYYLYLFLKKIYIHTRTHAQHARARHSTTCDACVRVHTHTHIDIL